MKITGLAVTILLLLGYLLFPCSGASAATDGFYSRSETAYTWDGTEASRARATSADYDHTYGDESSMTYTLPWSFNFYGTAYTSINADTNGNIWFTASGSAHSFNLATTGRGPVIAAWNDDLSSYYYGGAFIQHKTNPERVVIEWQTETYTEEGYYKPNNLEVVLFQNGNIRIDYNSFSTASGNDFGSGVSIGDGSDYLSLTTSPEKVFDLAGRSLLLTPKCKVTASVAGNGNGTITPSSANVNYGSAITFIVTPAADYYLTNLTDNGVDVTSSVVNGSYTINEVYADHTLVATFAKTFRITTSTLPPGIGGIIYLPSYGGQSGVTLGTTESSWSTWTITSGSLPPGLTMEWYGWIHGTPTQAGNYPFTVQAVRADGAVATKDLTIAIDGIGVKTAYLAPGTIGAIYSQTLIPLSGNAPYSWSIPPEALPPGLVLNGLTGVISGTPTAVGIYPVNVVVIDSASSSATKSLVISINDISAEWTNTVNGIPTTKVDAAGNTYITLDACVSGTCEISISKYGPSGQFVWQKAYQNASAGNIAVDANGNVYLVARFGWPNQQYVTVKYDPNGVQLWNSIFSQQGFEIMNGRISIAVDPAGPVYIAGDVWDGSHDVTMIVKYDSDNGNQLGTIMDRGNGNDIYGAILTVDGSSNLYVTSYSYMEDWNTSYVLTEKYNASGSQIWKKQYDAGIGTGNEPYGMSIDAAGNVYVVGSTMNTESEAFIIRYDSNGIQQWARTYGESSYDAAYGVVIDANHNLFMGGESEYFEALDTRRVSWIKKYDSNDNAVWSGEGGVPIGVDSSGNLYVQNTTWNGTSYVTTITKYLR